MHYWQKSETGDLLPMFFKLAENDQGGCNAKPQDMAAKGVANNDEGRKLASTYSHASITPHASNGR